MPIPATHTTQSDNADLQLCKQWLLLNKPFAKNKNQGSDAPNSVDYTRRQAAILLAAPHAVRHERNGKIKGADKRTGGLVKLLSQQTDTSSLVTSGYVQKWQSWSERNDDFRTILEQEILEGSLVLDIHGMSDSHHIDICLGLGARPSIRMLEAAHYIQATLRAYSVAINKPFAAIGSRTVRSYAQYLGGDAIQIEIAAHLRDAVDNTSEAAAFARSLSKIIRQLATT